ncbi:MAG: LytTR family DNA-binding domain-containing protein, partial [Parvularcula sp.]|nr:LytTR family DNA-binding domain-containing protein [Parvularcula sp.]
DRSRSVGTSGDRPGRAATVDAFAFPFFVAAALSVVFVNALSLQTEAARQGVALGAAPWIEEGTSAAAVILLLPVVMKLTAKVGFALTWRVLGIYAAASVVFSLAHVALMVTAREWLMPLATGENYAFFGDPLRELFYEYRKDALTFATMVGALFLLRRTGPQALASNVQQQRENLLLFRSGGERILLDPANIISAKAAGNYVEVRTAQSTELLRDTLSQFCEQLRERQVPLLATHRSWAVNLSRVRKLVPDGQGGGLLVMDEGSEVPISRSRRAAVELQLAERAKGGLA